MSYTNGTFGNKRKRMIPYQVLDGAKVPIRFKVSSVRSAMNYEPKKDDIFIVSYPKCGTTWVQYIVYLLFTEGKHPDDVLSLVTRIPFVERDGFPANKDEIIALKYHLPFDMVPQSAAAKYIYVSRNVMDAAVSYYHFFKSIPDYESKDITFSECLDSFLTGDCLYGDYSEHVVDWYLRRNEPNVLFLTYEYMKADHRGAILRIAEFLGKDLSGPNEKLLDDIVHYSGVGYMKEKLGPSLNTYVHCKPLNFKENSVIINESTDEMHKKIKDVPTDVEMVRKGKIGDWRDHFSDDQRERTINCFMNKTGFTDLHKLWPEIFGEASRNI